MDIKSGQCGGCRPTVAARYRQISWIPIKNMLFNMDFNLTSNIPYFTGKKNRTLLRIPKDFSKRSPRVKSQQNLGSGSLVVAPDQDLARSAPSKRYQQKRFRGFVFGAGCGVMHVMSLLDFGSWVLAVNFWGMNLFGKRLLHAKLLDMLCRSVSVKWNFAVAILFSKKVRFVLWLSAWSTKARV